MRMCSRLRSSGCMLVGCRCSSAGRARLQTKSCFHRSLEGDHRRRKRTCSRSTTVRKLAAGSTLEEQSR